MLNRKRQLPDSGSFELKTITKRMAIGDHICTFIVEDVQFAVIDGKKVMLDEEHVHNMVVELSTVLKRNHSKYNPLPTKVVLSKYDQEGKQEENSEDEIIDCIEPRFAISDVYIPDEMKSQLDAVLSITKHQKTLFEDWGLHQSLKKGKGIVLNFFGPPGTGKSMLAEAIAHELNKKVYVVNYANLESKYVGETPKNIRKAFQRAQEEDAVLVFDESDSFLGKRLTNVNQSADYGVNITRSVMLVEIENFEGVVIFTTNLLSNYDDAFRRRILANLEFTYPDEVGRERIWSVHIPKELPLEEDITPALLANKYEGITGADIKDIVLNAAVFTLQAAREKVSWEEFDRSYQFIKQRYVDYDMNNQDETELQDANLGAGKRSILSFLLRK